MSVSGGELLALATEIEDRAANLHVKKIYQPGEHDLLFSFSQKNAPSLLISVHKRFGRILLTERDIKKPESPSPFAALLRKHFAGKKLQSVFKQPGDRILKLTFSPGENTLYCKFYGRVGYLVAHGDGTVIGESGFSEKYAPLRAGDSYKLPQPENVSEEPADIDGSPSELIEKAYDEKISQTEFEEEKIRLGSSLRTRVKKLGKLVKALEKDRGRLLEYERCKKYGDLCQVFFNKIPRGADTVSLTDPESGAKVKIPLSPEFPPRRNIELLYKKYRKYKTGFPKVDGHIKKTAGEIKDLIEKIGLLEKADSMEELEQAAPPGSEMKPRKSKRRKGKKAEKSFCKLYRSAGGRDILIGRNSLENDELVRKSRGNDLWFHVRDFPGSHVVLRTGKNANVPHTEIDEAAKLALKHSSRAKDKKGIVVYTHVKYLKRPKNAAPGKVLVTREKTIHVHLE